MVDTSAEISCCILGTEDPDPEYLVPSILRMWDSSWHHNPVPPILLMALCSSGRPGADQGTVVADVGTHTGPDHRCYEDEGF